jgi:hypothetical protein
MSAHLFGRRCVVAAVFFCSMMILSARVVAGSQRESDGGREAARAPHARATSSEGSRDRTQAERHALDAAKALIRTMLRYPVVLIDPELAPDPEAVRGLDAFIVTERDGRLRQKIYLNKESALFQRAADGDEFSVEVLAAVLVHEIYHLAGQKEPEARIAEQRFFSDLIAQGAVREADGLGYLAQLRDRPSEDAGHSPR